MAWSIFYIQWVVIDFLLVALSLQKQQVHNHIGILFNGTSNYIEKMNKSNKIDIMLQFTKKLDY